MDVFLDFDGTVVEHKFPNRELTPNYRAIEVTKMLISNGHSIFLNTYRIDLSHTYPNHMKDCVNYFFENDIMLSGIVTHKIYPPKFDIDNFIKNNYLYIDDTSENTPMIFKNNSFMVDWLSLEIIFKRKGIIK